MLKGVRLRTLKTGTIQNIILVVLLQHMTDYMKASQLNFSYSSITSLMSKTKVVHKEQFFGEAEV